MSKAKQVNNDDKAKKEDPRMNFYIKNGRLRKAFKEAENQSELLEIMGLFYLDSIEKEYITKDEVTEMFSANKNMIDILNENYISTLKILQELCGEVFKND